MRPLRARLFDKLFLWALSKNAPGGYTGESDKRWAYTIESEGDPYLTRILLPSLFGVRVYLHRFHRPDEDRNPHNHPWSWALSFLLNGSYTEERVEAIVPLASGTEVLMQTKLVRFFNSLTKEDYHRVDKLHGDVVTLFITGPHVQDWGFLRDGKHVPWRKYLGVE